MALTLRRPGTRNQIAEADSREERKYPLPAARSALIAAWMDARFPRDPRYAEGVITSCYYDTPQLDSYQESADGEFAKAKLRLRWYGDPVDPYAGVWIELKTRSGMRSAKQRLRFASSGVPNALGLIIPERRELADRLRELGGQGSFILDPTLEPTAIIRYHRIRWESADRRLRASLDTEVHVAAPLGARVWRPITHGSVLELKSQGDLPPQMMHFERLGMRRAAHSKYTLAVEELYGGERARAG